MDCIPQGARKAVRLCPWMDGLKIAPAFSALPTSVWVVFRKEPGRRCGYVQDVRYVVVPWMARSDACTGCTGRYLLLQYLHFHHPWWSYVVVPCMARSDARPWWSAENCSMHFPHSPRPCGSAENCSCIFRTSHVHVGRLPQGSRMARSDACPWMEEMQ